MFTVLCIFVTTDIVLSVLELIHIINIECVIVGRYC